MRKPALVIVSSLLHLTVLLGAIILAQVWLNNFQSLGQEKELLCLLVSIIDAQLYAQLSGNFTSIKPTCRQRIYSSVIRQQCHHIHKWICMEAGLQSIQRPSVAFSPPKLLHISTSIFVQQLHGEIPACMVACVPICIIHSGCHQIGVKIFEGQIPAAHMPDIRFNACSKCAPQHAHHTIQDVGFWRAQRRNPPWLPFDLMACDDVTSCDLATSFWRPGCISHYAN